MIRANRSGWTLLEMTMSIAITSIITGLIATLLGVLFEHNARASRLGNEAVSLARLADQFRADVRAASSIAQEPQNIANDTPQQITLTLSDDTRVVYRQQSDSLLRILHRAEQSPAQESYWLPERARVELHEVPSGVGDMATLMLDCPIRPEPDSQRRQQLITAALGRDLIWNSTDGKTQP